MPLVDLSRLVFGDFWMTDLVLLCCGFLTGGDLELLSSGLSDYLLMFSAIGACGFFLSSARFMAWSSLVSRKPMSDWINSDV